MTDPAGLNKYDAQRATKMPIYLRAAKEIASDDKQAEALASYMYKYYFYINARKQGKSRVFGGLRGWLDKLFVKLGKYLVWEQVSLVDMKSAEETLKVMGLATEVEKASRYVVKENQEVLEKFK